LYEQALQLAPKNARLWTNLGSAYYSADDFNRAYEAFKKALDLDAKAEKLNLFSLAAIDENFGRGVQALDEYRRFVSQNPGDKLIGRANDRIKALTANIRATQPLPTHGELKTMEAAQAAFDQGVKLQEAKQLDQALEQYQKAAMLSPKEGAYVFAIGAVYQAKNDLANAATYYGKAVALQPNNAEYKKYLDAVRAGQAGPLVEEAAKKYTAGDFAGAISLYRQALQMVPNDPAVHTDLASALQASDDFAGALQEYQTAFKLDPKAQPEVLYFIAALKEHFNRGAEALTDYRTYMTNNPNGKFKQYATERMNVLAKNPNNVQHLQTRAERENLANVQAEFDEAVKLQGAGKYAEAEAKYADLMQKNPREGAYAYARGTNYQAQGDINNAIAMYDKAVALDPTNADYKKAATTAKAAVAGQFVQKGSERFAAKDYAGAAEQYKQALAYASRQEQANIWTNIGIALQYADQWAAARDAYARGVEIDPKGEVDNFYLMGPLDETLGRGAQAFEDYKKYLQFAPKGKYFQQANARYQVLYYDKNKLEKLQSSQQVAAAQQASEAFNEAVQLQQNGKLDEALAKYQEALKTNAQSDSVWYSMGTAYQAKNDFDKAMEAYQKAVSLNPKEPSYKKVLNDLKAAKAAPLADSAIKKQTATPPDLVGAIADYEASLRIYDDPSTRLNLGTAYQANNQLAKAEVDYLRALQLDPKLNDAHYYLGTLYEQLNKPPMAKLEYAKYLQAAPTGQYAADAKNRLKLLK
jgi:tetratricopeptide (TPR) repeat protein